MPVKFTYKPNHKDMALFMNSEQARKPAIEVAQAIVADLKSTVKRSASEDSDGHLADSFEVNRTTPAVEIGGNPRVGAEVFSSHPAAAPEEFGGRRNRARRWLGKAGAKFHTAKKGVK